MSIAQLAVHNFRNLITLTLQPASKFNLFYGDNGSGKTSLLEAIYYLGLGRSFRSRLNNRIIHQDAAHFSLFAQILADNRSIPAGLERHANGESRIRVAQENARSVMEITRLLPIQLLNPDSRFMLLGSSKLRRQFIDWGVFHVEPLFLSHWQHAQRALKQRNAALKSHTAKALVQLWDNELIIAAQALNELRKTYVTNLIQVFSTIAANFLGESAAISLQYKPGWDETQGLNQILTQSLPRDLQLGYTQHGPHRTDLMIRINGNLAAQDILSQGQQKLLVYALQLAQGILLRQQTHKRCIYLLDDLPAELDASNRYKLAAALNTIDAQVFITGIEREILSDLCLAVDSKMFHVEQGEVRG
jgi:DNA replication and repair protein RecF